jgi:hypothetical protein
LVRRPQAFGETRNADRTVAVAAVFDGALEVGGDVELIGSGVHRVDGVGSPGGRLVVEQHQLAAEARAVRFGDAEGERDGDGGIDGVAARPKYSDAGGGGVRMSSYDHAVTRRHRDDLDRDRRGERGEEEEEEEETH